MLLLMIVVFSFSVYRSPLEIYIVYFSILALNSQYWYWVLFRINVDKLEVLYYMWKCTFIRGSLRQRTILYVSRTRFLSMTLSTSNCLSWLFLNWFSFDDEEISFSDCFLLLFEVLFELRSILGERRNVEAERDDSFGPWEFSNIRVGLLGLSSNS